MSRGGRTKDVPQKVKDAVDERDKQTDRLTGHFLGGARNLHHRQLRSQRGRHELGNLVTLSGSGTTGSHGWVHAHPREARRLGYIVPSWIERPGHVPLLVATGQHTRRWVRLRSSGYVTAVEPDEVVAIMRELGLWEPDESWLRGTEERDALVQGR